MGSCGRITKDYCDLTRPYYYACIHPEVTKNGSFPTCEKLANGDVTGLPVLIAFFATASLTFILAWTMMVFGVDCAGDTKTSENRQSLVDKRFWRTVWFCVGHAAPRNLPARLELFCHKLMLTFSDIHLATGAAVLIAGYSQACQLTIYHYHAVVYLAWISFTVHLLTLLICRKHLQRQSHVLKWRLAVMLVNLVLLVVAIALTGSRMWPSNVQGSGFSLDAPIACTWYYGNLKSVTFNAAVPMILVIAGFISRIFKVSRYRSSWFRHIFRDLPGEKLKRCFDRCSQRRLNSSNHGIKRLYWDSLRYVLLVVYLHFRAAGDLYESILLELIWTSLMLLYGAGELFGWRSWSELRVYETQWKFGQILLLILIMSPLLAIPEMLHSSKVEEKEHYSSIFEQSDSSSSLSLPFMTNTHQSTTGTGLEIEESEIRPRPTRPALLKDTNVAFDSIGFNASIVSILLTIMAVFGLMLWARFTGSTYNVGDLSGYYSIYMLPLYVAVVSSPVVIWWVLCAPFSRIINQALSIEVTESPHSVEGIGHMSRRMATIFFRAVMGGWSLIPMLVVLQRYGAFEGPLYISPDSK